MLLIIGFISAHGSDLFVETEGFSHKGGWVVDQQFMDQMGSPYLLAHGMGKAVEDAFTEVEFPSKGNYAVYVRTYNWTSPWTRSPGPGKFELYVGSRWRSRVLGDEGDSWKWQYAGKISVKEKGRSIVRLHDLSGFDGRCDAIYFTTEGNVTPPEDMESLSALRRKSLGLPEKAPLAGNYDFVVAGGGIAGMCAAVSAARLGCRVALINDRPLVGGNNSSEVRVHLGGHINIGPYKKLGNLEKEFSPLRGGNAGPEENYEDGKKLSWLKQEKGLDLYLGYHVFSVTKRGNRIVSVLAKEIESGKELSFEAPVFADCTGDGTLGYLSGADYHMGRESRREFGESLAPEKSDSMTMGSSVQWYSVSVQASEGFPEFSYGLSFDEKSCEKVTKGEWTWETGMGYDQLKEFERIRDYGLLVIYSNWSYLKNHSEERGKYAGLQLGWVAYIAGKRESRRLLGDYILTENDIEKELPHEDASFTTTWSIDLHRPDPANSKYFKGKEFKAVTTQTLIYPYAVPYRCLYSRNVENLFMAGRDISVSHVALGTVRVMRTTGMMGEVVGMAASLCKKYGSTPRGVYQFHLEELKRLMEKGVGKENYPDIQHYNEGRILSKDQGR